MKRATLAVFLGLAACVTTSAQQPPANKGFGRPPSGPTVSPYLNLRRGGGSSPAINYYGLVRPQLDVNRQLREVERDIAGQERSLRTLEEEIPATGHSAGFGNYLHYYNFGEQKSFGTSTGVGRSSSRSSSRGPTISTAPYNVRPSAATTAPSTPPKE
jgi:hypothetical protein